MDQEPGTGENDAAGTGENDAAGTGDNDAAGTGDNDAVAGSGGTVLYEVEGPLAWITMNRPEVANAQNSALIDGIDAAFDLADADDDVRVVILAGAGRHFSSGHDLKDLVGRPDGPSGADHWRAMRETPEGKFRHEEIMYFGRCKRIHDFRKPTIAAVQGSCVAAGLMLACMCDLIVAADDAVFQNPVLRMTGAGVELLVEPWELGIRKAKEFLWTGEKIDAAEAWRLGLVNRVVPSAELTERVRELATRVALVPPVTAQVVKRTINHTADLMGQSDSWEYHFMAHHWMHNTRTALDALDARKQKPSMKDVFAEHQDQ
jgi:enoyl-CoA hydratase